jgi:allantoin racemase
VTRILVINPNTTATMTATIETCAIAAASPGTKVTAVTPAMGPVSIESHYDEALAVPGLLAEIARAEEAGSADGYVIACFGDPGLDAARELARGPVVGIAEAAMRTAAYLGRGFSVVTTLDRTRGRAEDLAEHYGLARFCRRVRACDIGVLALEEPGAREAVLAECRRAVAEDGSDAVVLGCAGMADLCREISAEIGVPVVDGVAAATRMVETLVALRLRTGDRGEFARPPAKPYTGLLRDFQVR